LILRWQQYFVWNTASQNTKRPDILKIVGNGPLVPSGVAIPKIWGEAKIWGCKIFILG